MHILVPLQIWAQYETFLTLRRRCEIAELFFSGEKLERQETCRELKSPFHLTAIWNIKEILFMISPFYMKLPEKQKPGEREIRETVRVRQKDRWIDSHTNEWMAEWQGKKHWQSDETQEILDILIKKIIFSCWVMHLHHERSRKVRVVCPLDDG